MTELLDRMDADLMIWLNGFHNSYFDSLMFLISEKWMWVPLYVAIFVATLMKYKKPKQIIAVLAIFAITIALADTVCADIIRPMFLRPRPCHDDSGISQLIHTVNGYRGGHYGMASCHSANSFALATLTYLVLRSRKLTIFMYAWAVVHTYSRIYLGLHYPGDILVGGVVGTLLAIAVYRMVVRYAKVDKDAHPCPSYIILATGGVIFASLLIVSAAKSSTELFAIL